MHFTVRVTIDKPDHAEPGIYYLKKTQQHFHISASSHCAVCNSKLLVVAAVQDCYLQVRKCDCN